MVACLDNIRRVDKPSDGEFLERYLAPALPVVIHGLFSGQPLSRVTTIEQAIITLGDVHTPIQLEYTTRDFVRRADPQHVLVRLGEFLQRSDDDPETRYWIVGEQPIDQIPELRGWVTPPSYATLGGASLDDMQCKVFVAHRDHWAHAHYDLDGRPVLLSQVFGRKRVMLVPPDRGQLLDPMVDSTAHWSSVFIENLSDDEKLALGRRIGAYDTILEPGDTLFIPTAWWHYVDYVDTGMGFNIRVGRTPRQQRLHAIAKLLLPKHLHYWQGISQAFATGAEPAPALCERADQLLGLFDRARATRARDDVAAFGAALVSLFRAIYPDAYSRIVSFNDMIRQEPIESLRFEQRREPSWSVDSRVALARGAEVTETIADPRGLVILIDGACALRIEASSDADAFGIARALLTRLAWRPSPVSELAHDIGCKVEELVELLEELAPTGVLAAETT